MPYHIIWKNADGSLKVTNMHSAATLETTTGHKNYLISLGELASFQAIITSDQLPQDKYFRPAWKFDGAFVVIDTTRARQRHLDKLRRVRNVKLQDSDPDYIRALEQDDQTKLTALKTYRQALRDIPQTISAELQAAITPNEIRSIQPAVLNALKP